MTSLELRNSALKPYRSLCEGKEIVEIKGIYKFPLKSADSCQNTPFPTPSGTKQFSIAAIAMFDPGMEMKSSAPRAKRWMDEIDEFPRNLG